MHCDAFGGLDQNRPPLVSIYENEPMWGDVTRGEGPRSSNNRTPKPARSSASSSDGSRWGNKSFVRSRMVI